MSVVTGAGRPSRPVRDDLWAFVEQAQNGDPDGFAGLYNATRTEVHRHLLRLVCNHHTAEDLTAETFTKAWRNLADLQRASESPIGWLKVIGTRLALSYLRKQRHQLEVPTETVRPLTPEGRPESAAPRDAVAESAHLSLDLAAVWAVARDRLTETQRNALVGRYLLDLPTWDAVGGWMGGRGKNAARNASDRALKALRDDPRIAALDPSRTATDGDRPVAPGSAKTGSAVASLSHEATADPQTEVSPTEANHVTCSDYQAGDTVIVSGPDTPTRDGGTTMNTTTAQVTIGKVSNRKGARDHYDVAGRAHCGAGRGTIDPATRRVPDATINTGAVCLRCRKALRAALAARPATDVAAAGAAHYLQPTDEATAYDTQLATAIRTHLQAVHADRHPPTEADRLGLTGAEYQQHLLARLAADRPAPAGFGAPALIAA